MRRIAIALSASLLLPCGNLVADSFIRGDVNQTGTLEIADIIETLKLGFFGQVASARCAKAADTDDNGYLEVTDVVIALDFLFLGREPLPPPFPDCGEDPTPDELPCEGFSVCHVAEGRFNVAEYRTDRGATSVAAADLDRDGDVDLAVANANRDNVSVLMNQGSGEFVPTLNYQVGKNPRRISIGDLNDDGLPDLVVGSRGAPFDPTGSITLLYNLGGGKFPNVNAVRYPVSIRTWASEAADVNGDGIADVIAVGGDQRGFAVVFLNDGDGGLLPPAYYETERASYDLAIGDLDGDGAPDIVVANAMDQSLSVLMNHGNGEFASRTDPDGRYARLVIGLYPSAVTIADLNGDRASDIAALNGFPGELKVFLNRGRGRFDRESTAEHVYEVGNIPTSIASGDLDGDGDIDLAVSSSANDTLSIFLNRGPGRFGTTRLAPVGPSPESIATCDLDGDGDRDLVVANRKSDRITVLLNLQQ